MKPSLPSLPRASSAEGAGGSQDIKVGMDGKYPDLGGAVKVAVDRDACEANAVCAGLVPEVFEVDDEDVLHIKVADVPPELADQVQYAVRSCPKAALSLTD